MSARSQHVLGQRTNIVSYAEATDQILQWAKRGESHYVCLANTHMLVLATEDPAVHAALEGASLTCPDGMPVVWMQRLLAGGGAHVRGPQLTLEVLGAAAREGVPVGFYGGSERVLDALIGRMKVRFPGLEIAYACSPPFRALTENEDKSVVEDIRRSGARIVFIGLGCPKQEYWMAAHRDALDAVLVGVGAAFDMHAGTLPQAPKWMQSAGLEWMYRLAREPRRLARRYAHANPKFVKLAIAQLARDRRSRG